MYDFHKNQCHDGMHFNINAMQCTPGRLHCCININNGQPYMILNGYDSCLGLSLDASELMETQFAQDVHKSFGLVLPAGSYTVQG